MEHKRKDQWSHMELKRFLIPILTKELKRQDIWSHVKRRQSRLVIADFLEHVDALQLGALILEHDHRLLSE